MINNSQTNFLYLADCLPIKHPEYFKILEIVLKECKIEFDLIPHTKDIWARDFMPIQIEENKFVQFKYDPDYLNSKAFQRTISDTTLICEALTISSVKCDLKVDGGNIIRFNDNVMMCSKVFQENSGIPENKLIDQLKEVLEADRIIFLPWDKTDFTGHADGMLRLVNEHTALVNDYSKDDPEFYNLFSKALNDAKIEMIKLPYNPYINRSYMSGEGIYTNYLEMDKAILFPIFNRKEDELAIRKMEEVFEGRRIETIVSNEIAKHGGILNCISWNIKK